MENIIFIVLAIESFVLPIALYGITAYAYSKIKKENTPKARKIKALRMFFSGILLLLVALYLYLVIQSPTGCSFTDCPKNTHKPMNLALGLSLLAIHLAALDYLFIGYKKYLFSDKKQHKKSFMIISAIAWLAAPIALFLITASV